MLSGSELASAAVSPHLHAHAKSHKHGGCRGGGCCSLTDSLASTKSPNLRVKRMHCTRSAARSESGDPHPGSVQVRTHARARTSRRKLVAADGQAHALVERQDAEYLPCRPRHMQRPPAVPPNPQQPSDPAAQSAAKRQRGVRPRRHATRGGLGKDPE